MKPVNNPRSSAKAEEFNRKERRRRAALEKTKARRDRMEREILRARKESEARRMRIREKHEREHEKAVARREAAKLNKKS